MSGLGWAGRQSDIATCVAGAATAAQHRETRARSGHVQLQPGSEAVSASGADLSGRAAGWPPAPGAAAFAALAYLYVWLRIDTALIFHGSWTVLSHPVAFPTFSVGLDFLKRFLGYPGGPARYVAAFLCQLYYYPWCGAAVFALLVWCLTATTATVVAAACGRRPRVFHFPPGIMLLLLLNRYCNPMAAALAVLTATAGAAAYVRTGPRRPAARFAWFAVIGLLVYYLACGGFLLYGLMCAAYELVGRRCLAAVLACLADAGLMPLALGRGVLRLRLADAYLLLTPCHFESDPGATALYCGFWLSPVLAMVLAVLGRGVCAGRLPASERVRASKLARVLAVFGMLLAAALVLGPTLNETRRTLFSIEFYSGRGRWEALLKAARRLPRRAYCLPVAWDVNRALYHTGRLLSSMFAFPQCRHSLMVSPGALARLEIGRFASQKTGDVLFDLGLANEAQHTSFEALEFFGDEPRILRRLAIICGAKGQLEAARVLLNATSRDLIYGGWARRCLRRLRADPSQPFDPEVRRLRSVMLLEDRACVEDTEGLLRALLARNPGNRMAFEYLMAQHMVTGNLADLARMAEHLAEHGYARLPRHCEEALLIYAAATGMRPGPSSLCISADSREGFRVYERILAEHGYDPAAALPAVARALPHTYFLYYTSLMAGAVTL